MENMKFEEFKEQYKLLKTESERNNFIEFRIAELLNNDTKEKIGKGKCGTYNQFINSQDEIVSNSSGFFSNLKFDDFDCYKEFLDFVDNDVENYLYSEPSTIYCVQQYIWKYFGANSGDLMERMELYEKPGFENVSIKEFKNKNLSACTERSAMAHNLLKFVGFDSEMVFGKLNSDNGFHTYIIFKSEKQEGIRILYDPMNPAVYEKNNQKKYDIGACVINEFEYTKLLNGNSFKFNYNFVNRRCPDGYTCQEKERVYSSDECLYSKSQTKN